MKSNTKEINSLHQRDSCTLMIIVALFRRSNIWNQLRCPSADAWKKCGVYMTLCVCGVTVGVTVTLCIHEKVKSCNSCQHGLKGIVFCSPVGWLLWYWAVSPNSCFLAEIIRGKMFRLWDQKPESIYLSLNGLTG